MGCGWACQAAQYNLPRAFGFKGGLAPNLSKYTPKMRQKEIVKTAMGLTNTSLLGSDMKPKEINPMPDKRTDENMRVFRVRVKSSFA